MIKLWKSEKRRPKNRPEAVAYDEFVSRGLEAMKRGWPDYVVFVGATLVAVEVKPDAEPLLKPTQAMVMRALSRQGVPCFLFTPGRGFEPLFGSPTLESLIAADRQRRDA